FAGNGNGTIANETTLLSPQSPTSQSQILTDCDADGTIDVIYGAFDFGVFEALITAWTGNGDLTFGASVDSPAAGFVSRLEGADLTGDGTLDVVTVDSSTEQIVIYPGGAGCTFGAPLAPLPLSEPLSVAAGDMDRDGTMDLVGGEEDAAQSGPARNAVRVYR